MKTKGIPADKFVEMLDKITPDTMKNYQISSWFQRKMCEILDMHNDRGTDYENLEFDYLFRRIVGETCELEDELYTENKNYEQIIHECCDVANFVMMVAYKANQSSNNPLKLIIK